MLHQSFAGRAVSSDDVDDSGWQSSFLAKFSESKRSQRSEFRRLQHHGVPGSQCRSDFPRRHQQRKIPGDDLANNTTRFVISKLLLEKLRPAGMVVEVPCHEWNVNVTALADRFTVIHRLQNSEKTGMFLHQPCQRIEITRPDMWGEGSPLGKGRARCPDRGI